MYGNQVRLDHGRLTVFKKCATKKQVQYRRPELVLNYLVFEHGRDGEPWPQFFCGYVLDTRVTRVCPDRIEDIWKLIVDDEYAHQWMGTAIQACKKYAYAQDWFAPFTWLYKEE